MCVLPYIKGKIRVIAEITVKSISGKWEVVVAKKESVIVFHPGTRLKLPENLILFSNLFGHAQFLWTKFHAVAG